MFQVKAPMMRTLIRCGFRNHGFPLETVRFTGIRLQRLFRLPMGKDFVYSYQITMYVPAIIPVLNDKVRITKADGSISQKVMTVAGCGTTKRKLSIFL